MTTVILAFDDRDERQNHVADQIRQHWHELIALKPMERAARIDEILRANKEHA